MIMSKVNVNPVLIFGVAVSFPLIFFNMWVTWLFSSGPTSTVALLNFSYVDITNRSKKNKKSYTNMQPVKGWPIFSWFRGYSVRGFSHISLTT